MDDMYIIMQVAKEMKYCTVNTSVIMKYSFDVLTTILDAILHIVIKIIGENDMPPFLKIQCLTQNVYISTASQM